MGASRTLRTVIKAKRVEDSLWRTTTVQTPPGNLGTGCTGVEGVFPAPNMIGDA